MIKDIFSKEKLLAQFYDLNYLNNTTFPTPDTCSFQFGYTKTLEKKELVGHIHKKVKREIFNTSEFIYVISGKMTIDVYNEDEDFVQEVVLTKNTAILQFFGGHKITIEKDTLYFELKQGPYFGRDFDKYELKI